MFFSSYKFCFQKRYLIFLILWLSFYPAKSSFAEGDIEGSFRVRGVLSQIQTKKEPLFLTLGRLHVKGEFRPSNEFKSQIHFLSSNSYGKTLSFEESIKIYPSASWLISEDLELSLGRILYENDFNEIVSINDYETFFYAFDGAFLEYSTKILNVNFWGAYLPKKKISTNPTEELKYGLGFFLDIESISDYINQFNAHVVYLGDSFFNKESQKSSRYGLGLKGSINQIHLAYTLVAIGHGDGVQFKLKENMYHFYVSYSRPEFFDSKISAGYHRDSSQYKPWLYDHHENAGFLDLFLWGNLNYYFLNLNISFPSLFDIDISFYDLKSTDEGSIQMGYFASLLNEKNKSFPTTKSQSLGKEIDIQLEKKISEDFEFHFLAGFFIPHLRIKEFFQNKDFYNNIQLTALYKF